MKRTMENDSGKPQQSFPRAFRPGGQPVEGAVTLTRGGTTWTVLGVDANDQRVFARAGEVTAWLECGEPVEIHELHSFEPVDVVCGCPAFSRGDEGFTFHAELELWVHVLCDKPTSAYLASQVP